MRLLNLVLIVGVCFVYHNIATIRAEKEAKIAAENSGSGLWDRANLWTISTTY